MAQQPIAIAGSKGLPVFRTPKHGTNSFHIAATTICLGLRRPRDFNRVTSGSNLTFKSEAGFPPDWSHASFDKRKPPLLEPNLFLIGRKEITAHNPPPARRQGSLCRSNALPHSLAAHLSNSSTLAPPSVTAAVASMAGPVSRSMDAAVNFRPGSIAKRSSCVMFWLIRQTRNVPSGARTANALRLSCPAQAASEPARRARPAQT